METKFSATERSIQEVETRSSLCTLTPKEMSKVTVKVKRNTSAKYLITSNTTSSNNGVKMNSKSLPIKIIHAKFGKGSPGY